MNHARSDLTLAKLARHEDILLDNLCFNAQKAAEKALKACQFIITSSFRKRTISD
ncbi:MAG: HEPN domain-containing protein [Spirochaetes bacterium]|nr:HEPN domain-containing protein [Spirochaetota bacterium]